MAGVDVRRTAKAPGLVTGGLRVVLRGAAFAGAGPGQPGRRKPATGMVLMLLTLTGLPARGACTILSLPM